MLEDALNSIQYAPAGTGVLPFLLLTVALGGGAAWRTGQAVAEDWGPPWPVLAYTALLGLAVRFLHFALFAGYLLSLPSYLLDVAILMTIGLIAHRVRRVRHMTEQYPWAFVRSGPFSWRERS
jgi:hypothetical protein